MHVKRAVIVCRTVAEVYRISAGLRGSEGLITGCETALLTGVALRRAMRPDGLESHISEARLWSATGVLMLIDVAA